MELAWDPEIDTPATIAVIGGGPVGVEAALYARFLGYSVLLFDSHKVGHRQLAWGDHPMGEAWNAVTSSLGLAALEAQGTVGDLAAGDGPVSYRQYVEKYLLPVARTDLLYDSVQINSPVISLSRVGCDSESSISIQRRAEQEFRLLVDSRQRGEYSQLVDIVLDCSGLTRRRGLASGGGLAIGETALHSQMLPGKVDVLGKHRASFAGQHVLLFGRDLTACANAIDLAQLALEAEGTRTTWIVPKQLGGPSLDLPTDCPARFVQAASELLGNSNRCVVSLPVWGIEALQQTEQWTARLQTSEEETLDICGNVLINCHAPQRDWSFTNGLYLTSAGEIEEGVSPEPHYYVLGEKGLGRPASIAAGLAQIRRVFALIGGRAELDLYAMISSQPDAV